MFSVNNNNNGIPSQNVWDQMALFNQLTLCNILNRRNDLGTPELRAAVVSMSEEQKDNVLVILECNTEELAGLPNSCGVQAVANTRTLWTTFLQIPTRAIKVAIRFGSVILTLFILNYS